MNIKIVLIFVLVSAIVVFAEEATEDKIIEEKEKDTNVEPKNDGPTYGKKPANPAAKQCKLERQQAFKSTQGSIDTCVADYKTKAQTASKQATNPKDCIAKCVLDAEISLDENGLVTSENLVEAVKQRVTGDWQTKMIERLSDCNERLGKSEHLVPKEDCRGYEKLALCMQEQVLGMCKEPTSTKDEL